MTRVKTIAKQKKALEKKGRTTVSGLQREVQQLRRELAVLKSLDSRCVCQATRSTFGDRCERTAEFESLFLTDSVKHFCRTHAHDLSTVLQSFGCRGPLMVEFRSLVTGETVTF